MTGALADVAHAGPVGPVVASVPASLPPPELLLLELVVPNPPLLLLLEEPKPPLLLLLLELVVPNPPLLLLELVVPNPPLLLLLLPPSELVVLSGSPGSAAQAIPTHAAPVRNAKICPVLRYIEDLGAASED
jgi:hypothetical protein